MKDLPATLMISVVVLILQMLTFSTLLSTDILSRTLQILFYGPYLAAAGLLQFLRDSWGLPIPSTMFGGLPGWLVGLLLLLNWLVYSLFGFIVVRRVNMRRQQG